MPANPDTRITVAICSYNGAERLPGLISALRSQYSPVNAEILIIDNNSTDNTKSVVAACASEEGIPLRYVFESKQGIPYARNRAVEEARGSEFLAFIDADELPGRDWLASAVAALRDEEADCVGGVIKVKYPGNGPPPWLTNELSGFLGQLDHGPIPFWVKDSSTPVWSGNVAYKTGLFSTGLRFDVRYNRSGKGIGGGSDGIMFRKLLGQGVKIRYRPDMVIYHHVEKGKLKRSYFIRLHYMAGRKYGEFQMPIYKRSLFGIAPFMIRQLLVQAGKVLYMAVSRDSGTLRQVMNVSYAAGTLSGRIRSWKNEPKAVI